MIDPLPTVASIRAPVWLLPRLWNSPNMVACVSVVLRVALNSPVAFVWTGGCTPAPIRCDSNERPIAGLGLGLGLGEPVGLGLGLGLGPVKPMKVPVRMFEPAF